MNKIFKTLKNHRTGAATAVSELQTGRTKGSRLKAVVVAAVAAAAALSSGAEAAEWGKWGDGDCDVSLVDGSATGGVSHVGTDFAFGNQNQAALTYGDDLTVWGGKHELYFEDLSEGGFPTVELDLDKGVLSLVKQSQGFGQAVVQAKSIEEKPSYNAEWYAYSIRNATGDNIFEQSIKQDKEQVAVGRYIIGDRAQNLGPKDTFSGYSQGIKRVENTLYTATVLSELKLINDKTITLDVSGGRQNWGAHLTGEGGVKYVGGDKAKDVVTIKQLFESNQPSDAEDDRLDHRANNYTGATTVTNVTLNLERETSLGASGILTAYNANIVEVKGGALGTLDTIDFTNTELTTKDIPLAVTGATFEGTNVLNVTGIFEVDGAAEISKGSLTISDKSNTTGRALFSADSLKLDGAKLTASSASVSGDSTVSGESSLDISDNKFDVDGMLTLTSGGSLTAQGIAIEAGDLTINEATLDSGDVTVTGTTKVESGSLSASSRLTGNLTTGTLEIADGGYLAGAEIRTNKLDIGQDTEISAKRFEVTETVDFGAGNHGIATTDGAFFKQDVTVAENGSVSFTGGDATVDGDLTVGKKSRLSADTISVKGTVSFRDTSSLSVTEDLWVGQALTIEGEYRGNSDDNKYTYKVNTQALDDRSGYDVTIRNLDAVYDANATMTGVKTTKLDNASLELPYANTAKLGSEVVMVGDGGNLLTFKADDANPGFILDGRFVVREEGLSTGTNLGTRNVVEFKGQGRAEDTVTFTNNAFAGDDYNGWIRMTGTTVDLADALSYDSGLSLSIGRGGTIVYDESVVGSVHRLGWTSEGDSELSAGVLDLSGVDFAQFGTNDAVLKVQELVVSGAGTILLNKSAVQNIGTSGAAQGDDIFDAISGGDYRLVIATIRGHDQEYYGSIDVKVEGADEKPLTGFFDANGKFTGDTPAAARGTWGYTTKFSDIGLGLTYSLDKLELLAKNTQEGVGAFTLDTTQLTEHTDFGVTLTGSGDLNVEGTATGTLHLTGANTMTGTVYVKSGTLMAEAGSLGSETEHASLDVAEGAEFQLNGEQYLGSLNSKGDVTIGNANNTSLVVLKLAEGGTLYADSRLKGGQNSVLSVMDGTLVVEDLENVAGISSDGASDDAFAGCIRLEDNATLSLTGTDHELAANLSMVTGTGTIELKDKASYGTKDGFTGTTVVNGGWLTIGEKANTDTSGNRASLAMSSGTVDSTGGSHKFKSIKLTGGQLNFGAVMPGPDATGVLIATDKLELSNISINVDDGAFDADVPAESLMKIDNVTGATSWLIRMADGASGTIDEDSIDINIKTGKWTSEIIQDGKGIGDITYESGTVVDKSKGIGVNYHATEMSLEGVLELAGSDGVSADSTLDLEIKGTPKGGILVTDKTVTLAQKGSYGTLSVAEGATVSVKGTQTLAQGGNILGTVETAEKAELRVTGGTLTIGGEAGTDFAVSLAADKPDQGATLRFKDRQGTAEGQLFEGTITTGAGSHIEFAGTDGNFSFDRENVAYSLENSNITFGPAVGKNFIAGTVAVDEKSTAYFNLSGEAAGEVDLSGVTGNGKLALNYDTAGGELVLTDTKIEGFTGTLAFANATATIGTDESVKNSVLNRFVTEQGELEVGAGSTLFVNNQKDRAADGSFTPHAVKLAGDLTISDRATLDFTDGVFDDHGKDHLGNTSGLSVNVLDLGGNRLVVTDSGNSKLTVRASIDKLDFGTGLPSNGEYHGSILDMLGETPDYPVLTVVTGIDMTEAELASIASDMVLEGESDNSEHLVKFWQPNWDPESDHETVHVANVHTGVRLVADKENNGIAIGAGITQIDIVSGATLRMDSSASESGATNVDASITEKDEPGNVLVTNSLGNAPAEGVKFLAENTYTGETVIDFGAKATVGHASAFASSKVVRVGTMSKDANGNLLEDKSILVLDTTQVKGSSYENAVKMKAIELGDNGKLEIEPGNDLILTGNGTSTFAKDSVVEGNETTTIGLQSGNLTIENLESLSGFEGAFRVNTGASVNFTVEDGSYTWKNDVRSYTDARSRATGAGKFVKSGAGTLVIGDKQFAQPNLSGMNLVVAEGTAELNSAKILGLETQKGTVVDVNGIFTTHNLTADAGSVFNLNVVTGKPFNVKEGESTSKKSIWGLGENGSDGIRVTGTASGTLNLAVTPKEVGAEESIQLVDAADTKEGFTVSLVDEKGAKLEGLTVGAYDYTLVRKDDAQNGTDIFLSSIPGEDEKRNTTVTAGSYIGVAAAAQLFDISLHDRMSNRSWLTANADGSIANSFWVLETVSNERYGDSTGQIDVHDTASTTTVGSDILSGLAAGGTWYAGAMFSYATEDTKSRSNRTALESRADTDAWAAGLYAGWQLNGADRTGPYVDGWILWTDAESDVKGVNVSETVDGNGLSASIEAGWGFKALSYNAHGQAGDIYVEPHVSVTWFGYEADDVSNDVHDVTFEGKDNIRTKLGVKTYAFGKNSGGFSPYVELNWIHNTETYGVTMSNVTVEQVGAEDQGEVRAGADWRINDAFTVWGHFGITSGSDGYSNREASLGVRYNF